MNNPANIIRIGSLYGVNGQGVRLCVVIQHGFYDASDQDMEVI